LTGHVHGGSSFCEAKRLAENFASLALAFESSDYKQAHRLTAELQYLRRIQVRGCTGVFFALLLMVHA
jgi:hypothetical protein